MKRFLLYTLSLVWLLSSCNSTEKQTAQIDHTKPPKWTEDVIWYQIFVERFNNGDTTNDPTLETMYSKSNFVETPENWELSLWTEDWYKQADWTKNTGLDFYGNLQMRRYGGDLQGVLDKLDYLQELGITAIYFNPLNDAPSLHKYDARNYHHIDVNFGPDPKGDMELIASENPADPSTWKWTAADKMFLKVIEECHQRGMRVILDYSWNHTGVEFWAWRDIMKNQEKSAYKDWYIIEKFDDPSTPEINEFKYEGWLNLASLPNLKKVNTPEHHTIGFPYEGNLHPKVKQHVFDVSKRWLAPNGDVSKGLDGYRLDVADHIPMGFWRDYRTFVKSVKPDAYLVGEIWWQEWPDMLMNPVPYVSGDVFDAVMHYQVYRPARYFFAKNNYHITAEQLKDSLEFHWSRLELETIKSMMNVSATHDSPRLLTSFANPGKYKHKAKPNDDENYITGKPNAETYQRVKLYLMHQFTTLGSPQLWNGDEMGMWGSDDPDCRKPIWWPEYSFEPENRNNISGKTSDYDEVGFNANLNAYYKKLIQLRKNNATLVHGEFKFVEASGDLLVYSRNYQGEKIVIGFNVGEQTKSFTLSKKYKNLLSGKMLSSNKIELKPISGIVLKEIKE